MTTDESSPLVGPEVDLTDFPFMPIMVARLKQSRAWLICKRKPELAFYMLNLWTASWHGRPAGSIEDDDLVLADLAMASEKVWTKIKADVLRGWVRCADGRIYHPVVSEQAREAWTRKMARRNQTEAARVAREARRISEEKARQDSQDDKTRPVTEAVTEPETDNETSSKGQGQGQGQGQGEGKENAPAAQARAARSRLELDCRSIVGEEPVLLAQDFHVLEALLDDGLTDEDIRVGVSEGIEKRSDPQWRFRRWESFAKWCRTAAQNRLATAPRSPHPPVTPNHSADEPRVQFGGGYSAPHSTIRMAWDQGNWLPDWGPRPGEPGCRVPPDMLAEIMGKVLA